MTDILIIFIPITAIVMGIGIGMLAIYLNYRKRTEMFALYHQERMAAIEKGIELPPLPEEFFFENNPKPRKRSTHGTFLSGLILAAIGATLYLAIHFTAPRTDTGGDAALFALIPGGVGVACLIYYFVVGKKQAESMEAERKARLTETSRFMKP